MLGLEFQRASALFLLALPLVLWLLARRPRPPHERATGTLDIWREVLERSAARPTTRGRGVPPGLYALFLGLALGALALAGPRTHREAAPEWRVVLDTRASMYLPWREEAQSAGEDRRIDVALRAAREWIDGPALWTRFDGAHWESVRGLEPPPDWLRATNRTTTAMPWSEVDRADALWVTDRAPESREASWCASGGAHVDGIVGRVDGRLVELRDGARIELGAASPVRLVLDASLPRELRGLSEAWARERGIELVASGADLRVGSGASREGARVVLGDGWQLSGAAAQEPAGEVLWRDREGAAALATRTGQLQ
ncbi:MAG: hypothetical protein KDC14_05655, partial [Planctomycetes bacterium]|nr:hypothetical protein [Planctomycetota bacterium]